MSTHYACAPLNTQPENDFLAVVDFLSESVELFERRLQETRREIGLKRARLGLLRLEIDRLGQDAERWGEIANRDAPSALSHDAHRKLIEKSRGIAALCRLSEMLERDIARLEPKVSEDDLTIRAIRYELSLRQGASR